LYAAHHSAEGKASGREGLALLLMAAEGT
jgi:hypothetical protein